VITQQDRKFLIENNEVAGIGGHSQPSEMHISELIKSNTYTMVLNSGERFVAAVYVEPNQDLFDFDERREAPVLIAVLKRMTVW
jgi:hypothetical protein